MGRETCPTCNGSGVVYDREPLYVDGGVRTVNVPKTCRRCGGSGRK